MGLRFQRRIGLFPGVRLNLSKSGVSTPVGRRGLWFTFGPRGQTRETIGLPGTGLRYTEQQSAHRNDLPSAATAQVDLQSIDATAGRGGVRAAWIIAAIIVMGLPAFRWWFADI